VLALRGADRVVAAGTELVLALGPDITVPDITVPVVDPARVLARRVVAAALPAR
jgi:aspartate/glutamate racemase